jgi:hypothetical protein
MAKSYDCVLKFSVSHTTDDLVFLWDPLIPLVVDRIELPQLDLVKNETGDCTQVYSTGQSTIFLGNKNFISFVQEILHVWK